MLSRLLRPSLAAAAVLLLSGSTCPEPCAGDPTGPCDPAYPPPTAPTTATGARALPIAPIAQQTPVWCWAATAEMVFRHFGLPNLNGAGNFQCGVVAVYFGGACASNCGYCVSPIGGMGELQRLVNQYGAVARQLGVPSRVLTSRLQFRALTIEEVAVEIDAGRPVIAGISAGGFPFPNFSQHVTVIVGYDARGIEPAVIVNDPFPYELAQFQGQPNPYLAAGAVRVAPGQYRISHERFVRQLNWANTIYAIQAVG